MLSDALFLKYRTLFFKLSGIMLKEYKKYLVEYRLQKFVGEGKQFKNFKDLYEALLSGSDPVLRRDFINTLTTNYTFFFREPEHFAFVAYYMKERAAKQDYVRLWSAACSTGEEPYSMAIMVKKHLPGSFNDIKILATDISERVLQIAREGVYPLEKLSKSMDPSTVTKYFNCDKKEGTARVGEDLRKLVTFGKVNLIEPPAFRKRFDIVFLRNVLIYFENSEKEHIISRISDILKPGGYLIVGLAESLVGIRHSLKQLKYSIYRKE